MRNTLIDEKIKTTVTIITKINLQNTSVLFWHECNSNKNNGRTFIAALTQVQAHLILCKDNKNNNPAILLF